jgi:branched-chain amino acid transport system permease protein
MALIASPQQWVALGLFILLLVLMPHILGWTGNRNWLTPVNFTMVTIIAVLGLNIITGMAGQISLGHTAFTMTGGYVLAVLILKAGWPFWAALLSACLVTAAIGILVASPAIRLKGLYVAVVTLAFFFVAQYLAQTLEITGKFQGLSGVPSPSFGGLAIDGDTAWFYFILGFTILAVLASANIARSRFGRAFFAIRDNEVTAASLGINIPVTKLLAFFVGSLFAGLAGGLWTSYLSVIRLDQYTIWDSIWYLGMIIIGGAGSTAGVVMGVFSLMLLRQILHAISMGSYLSSSLSIPLTHAAFGLAIIFFVSFQPYGLISVWRKFRINYKKWPFGY